MEPVVAPRRTSRSQPAILSTLQHLDADVIGLQEVCSREPDQPAWLRDELGLDVAASPDGADDQHTIVNAIASRWPIIESDWRWLDVGDMPKHRTVLWAQVDTPVGPDVFTTHLSHGFDQRRRVCANSTRSPHGPMTATSQ